MEDGWPIDYYSSQAAFGSFWESAPLSLSLGQIKLEYEEIAYFDINSLPLRDFCT